MKSQLSRALHGSSFNDMRNLKPSYLLGRLNVRLKGFKDQPSFSSLNEDNILDWLTGFKPNGTYIDIGAHHPDRISNTKLFYERGWRGINIEPDFDGFRLFLERRPEDINLNTAIGEGTMKYFQGEATSAGNTFNQNIAQNRGLVKETELTLTPLRDIYEKYNLTTVDFISIDVEGFEDSVLRSNDWTKYGARVICLEGYKYDYLEQFGYKRVFWDGGNCYYKLIKTND